jgi:ubiquitin-like-conjugating enzyme ATG3
MAYKWSISNNLKEKFHRLGDEYRKCVTTLYSSENLLSISKDSKLLVDGTLTPAEFVIAGDYLCQHFPQWKWNKPEEKSRTSKFLPEDKQYISCLRVICKKRVKHLDEHMEQFIEDDQNTDWTIAPTQKELKLKQPDNNKLGEDVGEVDDEYDPFAGLDDIHDEDWTNMINEANDTTIATKTQAISDYVSKAYLHRFYDISITYDLYYKVFRLWLRGYNFCGAELSKEEIYEDAIQSYRSNTFTHDSHPYTGLATAAIHPCKHADALKNIITEHIENGKEFNVEYSLIYFFNMISVVTPTVEYDCSFPTVVKQ